MLQLKNTNQHFRKTNYIILNVILFMTSILNAQNPEFPLWGQEIPGSIINEAYKETPVIKDGTVIDISKVTIPTLKVFVPKKPNGTSIVICPGGGYAYLAINKEGYKTAEWLTTLGITVFVLKYRLPHDLIMKDKTIGPLQDAQESIRYIRRNVAKWNLNPEKIGIMGFSAGGHLASTLSTRFKDEVYKVEDGISARPDFSILMYPVISMEDAITHKGSRTNLLGATPSTEMITKFSNQNNIEATTPLTLLIHAVDDKPVPIENSIEYFTALKKNNVPVEMHFYQNGKHGFGLGNKGTSSQNWTKHCEDWLRLNKWCQ